MELLFLPFGAVAIGVIFLLSSHQKKQKAIQRAKLARKAEHQRVIELRNRKLHRESIILSTAARNFQIAIQQLSVSLDFQRAAQFAILAARAKVPLIFRQRQFQRLRHLLIEHLTNRLQAGASLEQASKGLSDLVKHLGVAAFEADYIMAEAQRQQRVPSPEIEPSYKDCLRKLLADHNERKTAIDNMPNLEAELREQLLEAEHERFRNELLEHSDS